MRIAHTAATIAPARLTKLRIGAAKSSFCIRNASTVQVTQQGNKDADGERDPDGNRGESEHVGTRTLGLGRRGRAHGIEPILRQRSLILERALLFEAFERQPS